MFCRIPMKTVMLDSSVYIQKKSSGSARFPCMYIRVSSQKSRKLEMELKEALAGADAKDINKGYMELPDKAGDKNCCMVRKQRYGLSASAAHCMISALLVPLSADISIDRRVKEGSGQLLTDYPELVSKVTLYMSAGMSLRNVFFQDGRGISAETRARGEEHPFCMRKIRLTCNELKSGGTGIAGI
jgi:tight adherence protein C